jgi:hypothetical protein
MLIKILLKIVILDRNMYRIIECQHYQSQWKVLLNYIIRKHDVIYDLSIICCIFMNKLLD